MVYEGINRCPVCGGDMRHYDYTSRIVKTKNGEKEFIDIRRLRCLDCNRVHRELPTYLLPYLHYEKEIVDGVQQGLITPETLGYEDFPSEITMERWKSCTFTTDFVFTTYC